MAKKKAKKKTGPRRRRKLGAMALSMNPASPLMKALPVLGGYLLADKINNGIDKAVGTKIDGKIIAGAQVGLGGLYLFMKGKKNLLLTIASGVLAGAGVKRAMSSFGMGGIGGYGAVKVLSGYGAVPSIGRRSVAGYNVPGTLNGYKTPGIVTPQKSVMGGVRGSGLSNDGSDLMG
jgi:hypothetical protein